ncbi:MAG: bifunctional glutamine synthetase adenylyltransferase/deadenyltransferase, partial [Pseudomonadota bacterium]|nr:bifunctional glutamine synthetase adenylyltransferase/deadenyltransferase [Pseudomonadota bacterium]
MTNVELAEKFWQQLLTAPAISESVKAVIEAHCETLMLSFTRSSFLAETLIQYPSFVSRIVEPYQPPEKSEALKSLVHTMSSSYLANLNNELHNVASEDDLLQVLREFRNKEMARITFLDVLNKQPIEISLMQVSALADVLINGAYHWLYQHLAARYGKPQSH